VYLIKFLKRRKKIVKKIFSSILFVVLMLVSICAFAEPSSYSYVQGSVSEQNDAISQNSIGNQWLGYTNYGVAMGNQSASASFNAYPITPNGEDSNGAASVVGGILVYNLTTPTLVVSGSAGFNSGSANVNENPGGYPMTLNINGSLSLLSAGQIINSTNSDGGITNGSAGQATANGAYQIAVTNSGNYTGWEGSGSVKGYTFNLITNPTPGDRKSVV
jgi:hypothetical protein